MLADVVALSYSIAAIAFLSLALLLLTRWRSRLHSVILACVSLLTAAWAAITAYQTLAAAPLSPSVQLAELLRSAGWCSFLLFLATPVDAYGKPLWRALPRSALIGAAYFIVLIAANVVTAIDSAQIPGVLHLLSGGVGRVSVSIIGLLLVEQLFRHTPVEQRWAIKFACLGIAGIFAYDFYLYSDAMLFRRMNVEIWAARGIVDALAVPLVAVSAARNPNWTQGIALSRQMLFQSVALFGSSLYLLAMAASGYYLRYVGGRWGPLMQVSFFCGAVVLLLAILFSGTFRARLKVFISKHFYNYNYDYREEWLRFTRSFSKPGPRLGERAIRAIANLVESPAGVLFMLRDSEQAVQSAAWNMTLAESPSPYDETFFQYLESTHWVIDICEWKVTPEKYGNILVPDWISDSPTAWLVIPLSLQGKLTGFIVLARPRSPLKLNWEVLDLLKIAGNQAASYLSLEESTNALMVARQFESFNRMSTFIVHDLKNLVSQLSLMTANAERHKHNPEFQQDMLETIDHSVKKMRMLLLKLTRSGPAETAVPLSLDKLLENLVKSHAGARPAPVLETTKSGLEVAADPGRLERVIGHLLQNAVDATPRDGKVAVRMRRDDNLAIIECEDSGAGMSEEFIRDRLFKPFESTKPAGMGIGVFETREYISEIGGKIEVTSTLGAGTIFRVALPLYEDDAHSVLNGM
jgi:putative PEP-CTERM system histidine kinase